MINIVYTNEKCKDVYDVFKKQHDLFCDLPLFVISDYCGDYQYSNEEPYFKHWLDALKLIEDDYFIYNQEDFILYDKVKTNILFEIRDFLRLNPQYSFVRLIKSGQNLSTNEIKKNLYLVGDESFPQYSMQATIWNKESFITLYENTQQEKWFECQSYEDSCKTLKIKGLYYYSNEPKRGGHFDSSIYPYIATAVVKGKWNLSEYSNELYPLLMDNNIDLNTRGIY
jgi:hypothetical protein